MPGDAIPKGGENLEVMQEAVNYNRYLRGMIRRFGREPSSALDFGAGIGTFSDALGLARDRVHCVEPDAASREVLASKGFRVHRELSSVPPESIEFAFSLNVLEHIEDDESAARALFAVVRPGGRIFVYVPAFMCLFTSMDRHVGHVRRYTLPQLVAVLERAGFVVEKKGYADALGFFATLVLRLFERPQPAPLNRRLVRLYDIVAFPVSRLLSVACRGIVGKNAYVVARRAGAADGRQCPRTCRRSQIEPRQDM